MPPNHLQNLVHLPNGQNLTVIPVFGGFFFKSNELNIHHNVFPAGWTVILQTEDYSDEYPADNIESTELSGMPKEKRHHIHPFKRPTLQNDNLFISSISNPSSNDFKTPSSPTRQIAMMLWASLYWYFHQQAPPPYLASDASKNTPNEGKPRGEWRINIKREGVFRGRNLIQKLERMGLITSEDSSIGVSPEENTAEGWSEMFTSRRTFWQLSAKLFLFTLTPAYGSVSMGSPYNSRPNSPVRGENRNNSPNNRDSLEVTSPPPTSPGLWSSPTPGPFSSGSHLPTYFPPPPLPYTATNGIRHPMRPKPPRQGEIFYTRFIPSIGQYLAFRAASLSSRPVAYNGPSTTPTHLKHQSSSSLSSVPARISAVTIGEVTPPTPTGEAQDTMLMSDVQLLNKWMNDPRVSKFWGCSGPQSTQEEFLTTNLKSKNSFPAIGLWDGKPFGYFEIYWVKEDILGRHIGDRADDYDRGVHVLVGENEFRGLHRVKSWITSLAHWAFVQDYRTNAVVLEPRVDNKKFISHLNEAGFLKEGEVTFPHKQSAYVKLRRENFEAPYL